MRVAVVAKANPRRDTDLRFVKQFLGKFQRAHGSIRFRDFRPDIHRSLRHFDHPARFMQPFHQHITAAFVLFGNITHALLIALQRRNSRHLQRRKGAVIVIAFNTCQRADQRFVTDHKADTPCLLYTSIPCILDAISPTTGTAMGRLLSISCGSISS